MSAINIKFFGAIVILVLSLTEFIVYNEEVFLFVCFFVFFNAVASSGGKALGNTFESMGLDFEKEFVVSAQQTKISITSLVSSKKIGFNTVSHVTLLLQVFKAVILQKSLLSVLHSYVRKFRFYNSALSALSMSSSLSNFAYSSELIFSILSKKHVNSIFSSSSPYSVGSLLSVSKALSI